MPSPDDVGDPYGYDWCTRMYRGGFCLRELKSGKVSLYRPPDFLQMFDSEEEALDFVTATVQLEGGDA